MKHTSINLIASHAMTCKQSDLLTSLTTHAVQTLLRLLVTDLAKSYYIALPTRTNSWTWNSHLITQSKTTT